MPNGAVTVATAVPYLGELFLTQKRTNAILKLAGHFAGRTIGEPFAYKETTSKEFPIGAFYSLPAPSQPARLENAAAPTPQYRALTQATNVIQIFTEAVQSSYLAQSDKAVSGVVPIPQGEANGPLQNPRSMEFQVMTTLEKMAQDMNYSFLRGAYNNPADPTAAALGTRGVITAIVTNIVDQSAVVANTVTPTIYRAWINQLLLAMITVNGYAIDEDYVLFCGAIEYSNICAAYEAQGTIYITAEAMVAGVKIRTIVTRFGRLTLVMEPDVPANQIAIVKMDEVGIVALPVPNKGILFEEPLAKGGASDQTQIYGQLGIDHGPEYLHGLLKVPAGVNL